MCVFGRERERERERDKSYFYLENEIFLVLSSSYSKCITFQMCPIIDFKLILNYNKAVKAIICIFSWPNQLIKCIIYKVVVFSVCCSLILHSFDARFAIRAE